MRKGQILSRFGSSFQTLMVFLKMMGDQFALSNPCTAQGGGPCLWYADLPGFLRSIDFKGC